MRPRQSSPSIRRQLLALFGLLLLAGTTVLVIDEIAQYRARQSLQSLRDHNRIQVGISLEHRNVVAVHERGKMAAGVAPAARCEKRR